MRNDPTGTGELAKNFSQPEEQPGVLVHAGDLPSACFLQQQAERFFRLQQLIGAA